MLEYKSSEFLVISGHLASNHPTAVHSWTIPMDFWAKVCGGKVTLHDLPRKPCLEPNMYFLPNFDHERWRILDMLHEIGSTDHITIHQMTIHDDWMGGIWA